MARRAQLAHDASEEPITLLAVSPRPRLTDVRRRQILEAAADVIVARGLPDTRIADIAESVGVSPPLIMYYFESKDELLAEALAHKDRQFFDSVSASIAAGDSPADRLATLIDATCPSNGGTSIDDDYALWIEAWSRARHDEAVASTRRKMDATWRRAVAEVVAEGQAAGQFDAAVHPERFALKITALIDGLAIHVMLGDDDIGPEDMRRICLDAAGSELGFPLELSSSPTQS